MPKWPMRLLFSCMRVLRARIAAFVIAIMIASSAFLAAQEKTVDASQKNPAKAKVIAKQISASDGNYEFEIEIRIGEDVLSIEDIDFADEDGDLLSRLRIHAKHLQATPTTIAIADFDDNQPVYQYTSGFAGYQAEDGTQHKVGDQVSFRRQTIAGFGDSRTNATAGVIDASDLEIPESAKTNYIGCGVGMSLTLTADISKIDLSRIEVSFDAEVKGCKPLKHTKVLIGFVVDKGLFPAGANGPANANFDDQLCRIRAATEA